MNITRLLYVNVYPNGADMDEGEHCCIGTHIRDVMRMAEFGLTRYQTWVTLNCP